MRPSEYASMFSLLLLALLAGGAAFQLLVAADDLQNAVTFAAVSVYVVVAITFGTRDDRSDENPYW